MNYIQKMTSVLLLSLACLIPNLTSASESINLAPFVSLTDQSCAVSGSHKTVQLSCKTYHQTTNYTCGPAAVMTLMHYYNRLSSKDMNRQTELRIASEMSATPGKGGGTTQSQMADWLSSHGFSVDSGQNIDTDTLIDNIKNRRLTLVGFNQHWILAKGYRKGATKENDEVIFSDSCCSVRVIPRSVIDSMWQEAHMQHSTCGSNVGQYIIATPN